MRLFNLFKKNEKISGTKKPQPAHAGELGYYREVLSTMVTRALTGPGGKIRQEDAITLMAVIAAERCFDVAEDIPLRTHKLPPGSRISSEKINSLLFGGPAGPWENIPPSSPLGFFRDALLTEGFQRSDFPDLSEVISRFNDQAKKGQEGLLLTVPKNHLPRLIPLQIGFETRKSVDKLLKHTKRLEARMMAAVWALAERVALARESMPSPVAARLAVEVFYGTTQTAPITQRP